MQGTRDWLRGPLSRQGEVFNRQTLRDYFLITVGSVTMAVANDLFLIPNKVFDGGFTGVSIIINVFTGFPVGLTYLAFNVPLLLAALRWLGGFRFVLRTIYAVLAFSLLLDFLAPYMQPLTHEPILYVLYGGLLNGAGLGLILRSHASSGGAGILAMLVNRFRGLPISQSLLILDGLVLLIAGILLGPEKALYALIGSFASSRVVALVQEGLDTSRMLLIISNKPDEVANHITNELGRGATFLRGSGAYTGEDRKMVLSVVSLQEINSITSAIRAVDPEAFVIITDAREVLGEGFKPLPRK